MNRIKQPAPKPLPHPDAGIPQISAERGNDDLNRMQPTAPRPPAQHDGPGWPGTGGLAVPGYWVPIGGGHMGPPPPNSYNGYHTQYPVGPQEVQHQAQTMAFSNNRSCYGQGDQFRQGKILRTC